MTTEQAEPDPVSKHPDLDAYVVLSVTQCRELLRLAKAESVKSYGRVRGRSTIVRRVKVCDVHGEWQIASHDLAPFPVK